MTSLEDIIESFSFLDSWEDKYQYLIELGEALEPYPTPQKTDAYKVDGCMSQVWLYPVKNGDKYHLIADSDAILVKGLIAIILAAYSDKTSAERHSVPIDGIFQKLGLENNLSPTRRNGFFSMVNKIKTLD